jgi:hypothetical protein
MPSPIAPTPVRSKASPGALRTPARPSSRSCASRTSRIGSRGTRRAIARWSDGTESEALTYYADEILICEGDHGNSRLMVPRVRKSPQTASLGPEEGYMI